MLANDLSEAEKEEGYKLLFDGQSTDQFRSVTGDELPSKGWKMEDDELIVMARGGDPEKKGARIITHDEIGPFAVRSDFLFTEGAISRMKYDLGRDGPAWGWE